MSSNRLLGSIFDHLGVALGSFFASKMAEISLGSPLGAAQMRSRVLFCAPNPQVDAHRGRSGALQASSRRPRRSKRPPGGHFGPMWLPFGTYSGSILDSLFNHLGPLAGEKGLVSLPGCCRHAVCEVAGFGGAAPCEI